MEIAKEEQYVSKKHKKDRSVWCGLCAWFERKVLQLGICYALGLEPRSSLSCILFLEKGARSVKVAKHTHDLAEDCHIHRLNRLHGWILRLEPDVPIFEEEALHRGFLIIH